MQGKVAVSKMLICVRRCFGKVNMFLKYSSLAKFSVLILNFGSVIIAESLDYVSDLSHVKKLTKWQLNSWP